MIHLEGKGSDAPEVQANETQVKDGSKKDA
jgi:hypothetical protein